MTRARRPRIAVVDYGAGNLVSIDQALTTRRRRRHASSATARRSRGADALVVPGVGAAAPAMARLERRGLTEPIRAWIAAGRPFLGICLGLQLLFEGSDEDGATTLGVAAPAGRSASRTRRRSRTSAGTRSSGRATHPLFDGIADGADFYFVHSYAGAPDAGAERRRPRRRPSTAAVRLGDRARRAPRRPVPPRAQRPRRPAAARPTSSTSSRAA